MDSNSWMIQFCIEFIRGLITTDKELVDIGRYAYNLALAPHHPGWVVVLANIAIFALPWRKDFINQIIAD